MCMMRPSAAVDTEEHERCYFTDSAAVGSGVRSIESEAGDVESGFDFQRHRYPNSITWSPLPGITCCCPAVGHMGIADSKGVIYDFQGPYSIGADNMAFGNPTRYLPLDPSLVRRLLPVSAPEGDVALHLSPAPPEIDVARCKDSWDACVHHSNEIYSKRIHNICCDNCHSHVAVALEKMHYNGRGHWNMFILGAWVFFCGRFVSVCAFLKTFLPFIILLLIVMIWRLAVHGA